METELNLRKLDLLVDEQVQRMLRLLQRQTSFAVVAGGYLRDRYFQVAHKDIDFFVSGDFNPSKFVATLNTDWALSLGEGEWISTEMPPPDRTSPSTATVATTRFVTKNKKIDPYKKDSEDSESGEIQVFNLHKPDRKPAQVIVSKDYGCIADVLRRFDFGICQLAYDGYRTMVTDHFWHDAANYCGTFLRSVPRQHHREHADRIGAKYPKLIWVWSSS